jgi:glutaconyl-CoA/methylmalonyl-CoA decarboxylase subunit gamma
MKLRVKIDEQTFEVEVGDLSARPISASVDGETFEIWPEETETTVQAAAPVVTAPVVREKAPARPAPVEVAAATSASVKAPIPGLIITLAVKEGDSVKQGQELCILEAMKMKNAIRAPRAGVIASIRVAVGDHVKHGQALMDYAE